MFFKDTSGITYVFAIATLYMIGWYHQEVIPIISAIILAMMIYYISHR